MLTWSRRAPNLLALVRIVGREGRDIVGMLAVAQLGPTMLGRSSCLSGHLQLADLPVRETTVVGVLLRLLLRIGLGRGRLGHVRIGGFAGAREVDACRGGRDLALGLEEARLEVDDVVAELVVLCLQRLVQLAQLLELLDLVLELLDVLLLALAEGTLGRVSDSSGRMDCSTEDRPVRRGSEQRAWMCSARDGLWH